MNWLNLEIKNLTCEQFVGAEPADRATWLCLMRYCAQQETGGVILGAESWGERKWEQLCAITKAEVLRPSKLWSWESGNLIVEMYPIEQEKAVQAKRLAGKIYGRGKDKRKGKVIVKEKKGSAIRSAISLANSSAIESYPLDFVQFWTVYPNKKAKQDAFKAWQQTKRNRPSLEEIVKAVNAQKESEQWKKDGGRFIPFPATWIRAGRWDDEIKVEVAPKKPQDFFT